METDSTLPHFPRGPWSQTFPKHLLAMETSFLKSQGKFSPEYSVYLAGIVSRKLDTQYWKAVEQHFLVESPEEIQALTRKHFLFIGQNAPVVTVSRYNAEHLLFEIAIENDAGFQQNFAIRIPARYFGIASTYSNYMGNLYRGNILGFFSKNLEWILPHLAQYLEDIRGKDSIPEPSPLAQELWKKFAEEQSRKPKQNNGGIDWNSVLKTWNQVN